MPYFRLETNIPQANIPVGLSAKLCKVVAESLGRPLDLTVASVIGGVDLSWGGTNEPAAQATLVAIGALGVEENKKHSKALFDLISKELGLPNNRLYIVYKNNDKSDIGYTGTTFFDLLP